MALTPEKLVFEIDLPVVLYLRQPAIPPLEWKEVDSGPGQMVIPAGSEVYLRIKNIDDNQL
jgi:hypothetical protein